VGIRERQERERQAVARAILDAARDLFVSEGYDHVSMRKIAERIEYSPAAIYRYFSSKDHIFFALAEEGFRLMADRVETSLRSADPLDAVRRTFLAFYEFSRAHPEYFALMFLDRTVPSIRRNWERFAFIRETRGEIVARLRQCTTRGLLPAALDPEAAFNVLAAAVHGVAVMRLCDRPALGEQAEALARDVIEVALAGLRDGTTVTYVGVHGHEYPDEPAKGAASASRTARPASRRASRRVVSSSRGTS